MTEMFPKIVGSYLRKLKESFRKFRLEKITHRYSLIDVTSENSEIELHVIVLGIKKQVLKFKPEEIVFDDGLLSEFSPGDIRAITYLSFQKYIKEEQYSLTIERQFINKGATTFQIKDINTNQSANIDAKKLYQNYDLLIKLSRKDMINVISTAVQEQTIVDIKSMEML